VRNATFTLQVKQLPGEAEPRLGLTPDATPQVRPHF
jgi:hypothetical protein